MAEYYPPDVLGRSRELYETIKAWAEPRGSVTLIGGWAVYELVAPTRRMQSRDVDLVFHDRETLQEFDRRLASWNLQWREHGRNRFNDCHLRDDPRKSIVVDAWKASAFEDALFRGIRGRRGVAIKVVPSRSFLPGLSWLLQDKVETVPRRARDRLDKQAKDLLDVYALVFHNLDRADPYRLATYVPVHARRAAAGHVEGVKRHRPQNAEELDTVRDWLLLP